MEGSEDIIDGDIATDSKITNRTAARMIQNKHDRLLVKDQRF